MLVWAMTGEAGRRRLRMRRIRTCSKRKSPEMASAGLSPRGKRSGDMILRSLNNCLGLIEIW